MTTATSPYASEAQQKYISDLRARVGEPAFKLTVAELGCESDPQFIRKNTASKLIDRLIDTGTVAIPAQPHDDGSQTPATNVDGKYIAAEQIVNLPDLSDLTGREFAVSVADGYAYYRVTRDEGGFCTVVSQDRDHSYDCPVLGERAVISRDNIVRLVK